MDSFCELPRSAPKPSAFAKVPIISSVPTVPEVSMIFSNGSKTTDNMADSVYLSYKAWKDHKKIDNPSVNNNRGCSQNSQRKQLRFDQASLQRAPELSANPSHRPGSTHFTQNKNIPFDQIYMANIPNKQLELSILDSNPHAHTKNIDNVDPNIPVADLPTRHYLNVEKVVTESQSNKAKQDQFSTTYGSWFSKERVPRFMGPNESGIAEKNHAVDLYHQKTDPTISSDTVSDFSHNAISTSRNVSGCPCQRDNNDQTIKDLLKIIQQLNEQIIILQKQVTTLLNNQVPPNPRQTVPTDNYKIFNEDYKTNLQSDQHHGYLPKKPSLQQISLDVMTSFEVSIRRPPNSNKMCNNLPYPPKICEITETECNSTTGNILDGIPKPNDADLSFSLSEPQLQVRETCPSPVNSIRVEMKDYSSDSEEDEINNPAWTFYNNIMAQVNHILKKSGIQPTNLPPCEVELDPNDVTKQKMMRKVKQATIKHLKSIGVHIPPTETTDVFNDPSMCNNQNDVSFAVKQLLMKYLPNDQLTQVAHNKQGYQNVKQAANIKRRPEFSIATVQYMQKYNLLNDKPEEVSSPIRMYDPKPHFNRILDVTAIKKQPKLL